MKYDEYRKFRYVIRALIAHESAKDILNEFDRLRDVIYGIRSTAKMIVETQTEMHPAHRALVQQIVDATRQVEFEGDTDA